VIGLQALVPGLNLGDGIFWGLADTLRKLAPPHNPSQDTPVNRLVREKNDTLRGYLANTDPQGYLRENTEIAIANMGFGEQRNYALPTSLCAFFQGLRFDRRPGGRPKTRLMCFKFRFLMHSQVGRNRSHLQKLGEYRQGTVFA
jgi:hypothetical protein